MLNINYTCKTTQDIVLNLIIICKGVYILDLELAVVVDVMVFCFLDLSML